MVDGPDPDDEMSFLLAVVGNMGQICAQSLRQINLQESDKGVAALILKYAAAIDQTPNIATLAKLGPLLLQGMEALQMSPRARAVATKKVSTNEPAAPQSKLDELRSKRLERQNGTKTIHSATS